MLYFSKLEPTGSLLLIVHFTSTNWQDIFESKELVYVSSLSIFRTHFVDTFRITVVIIFVYLRLSGASDGVSVRLICASQMEQKVTQKVIISLGLRGTLNPGFTWDSKISCQLIVVMPFVAKLLVGFEVAAGCNKYAWFENSF